MAERPSDLLPCPFCGGTARIDWGKTFRYVGIECDSCAAFGGEITGIPSEADRAPYIKRAIKKWNTRARTLDAAPSEPVPAQVLPLTNEERAAAINAAGLPDEQRCELHALLRCIESQRAFARDIEATTGDPWAALGVGDDVAQLEALLDRLVPTAGTLTKPCA